MTLGAVFADAEVIHSYTRAQAIADGALVDVSTLAREAGIVYPLALTRAAWCDTVMWDDKAEARKGFTGNDETGRLWYVLSMARHAIRTSRPGVDRLPFQVLRIPYEGRGVKPRLTRLVLVCGPGDDAEPVLTVLQVGES